MNKQLVTLLLFLGIIILLAILPLYYNLYSDELIFHYCLIIPLSATFLCFMLACFANKNVRKNYILLGFIGLAISFIGFLVYFVSTLSFGYGI